MFKSMKIVLTILLNSIKRFDFETSKPNSLPSSSFKLNGVRVDPK